MRNLLATLNILALVALLGCKSVPEPTPAPESTWCHQWNTLGDVAGGEAVTSNQRFMFHIGFFVTKSDTLAEMIQQNNPTFDEATMANIIKCYEENTPALVDQLDKVCSTDNSKQDEQVDQSLNAYISWCIKQSTTQA